MAKIWDNPITDNTDWGGDSSTNNQPVSGRRVQEWIKARLKSVVSEARIEEIVTDIIEEKGIAADGGFVTLDSAQEITGEKNFKGGLKINDIPITYDVQKNAWLFQGNLLVTRGIASYTTIDNFDKVSVFDDFPFDGDTIIEEGGVYKVNPEYLSGGGGGGEGGSVDLEQVQDYLDEKGYATQSWVQEQKYLTQTNLSDMFVTVDTEQTITGPKDFTGGLKVSGMPIVYDAEKNAWEFQGNLLVTGGGAFYTSLAGFESNGIMDAIKCDDTTIYINENKELQVIGGGSGGGISEITSEMIEEALGYTPFDSASFSQSNIKSTLGIYNWALASSKPGYSYDEITDTPTSMKNPYSITFSGYDSGTYNGSSSLSISIPYKLSQLDDNILDGYYLPIDGTAVAADSLATSRRLWGQSFDGSTDITGPLTVTTGEGYRINFNGHDLRLICSEKSNNRGIWDGTNNRWVFGLAGNTNVYLPSGNIGIGVDLGDGVQAKLHVKGNAFVTGQIAHANTSDRRLKENIRDFDVSEYLDSLGGAYAFEYVDSEVERDDYYAGTHIGFIYQNIKDSLLSGMCIERKDGYGAINYLHSDYLALLGASAVSHEERIKILEQNIKQLQKELNILRA